MRRLHLLLAIRQVQKNKGFTLLNVLGLTLGLTTFLTITLYVVNELGYGPDHYHLSVAKSRVQQPGGHPSERMKHRPPKPRPIK